MSFFTLPLYTDQSVQILEKVFGPIVKYIILGGTTMPGGATGPNDFSGYIVAEVLIHFNVILISGCMLMFAYILVMGVFTTAEEGIFLGKEWSTLFISIRSVGGMALMLPLNKGFCLLQYGMMYLILLGVHMATTLWSDTLTDVRHHATPTIPTAVQTLLKQKSAEAFLLTSVDQVLKNIPNANANGIFQGAESFQQATGPILSEGETMMHYSPEIESIVNSLCPTSSSQNIYYQWLGARSATITSFSADRPPHSCQETIYDALHFKLKEHITPAPGEDDPRGWIPGLDGFLGGASGPAVHAQMFLGTNVVVPGMNEDHPQPIDLTNQQQDMHEGNFKAVKTGIINYDMHIPDENSATSAIQQLYNTMLSDKFVHNNVLQYFSQKNGKTDVDDPTAWLASCQSLQDCDLSLYTTLLLKDVLIQNDPSTSQSSFTGTDGGSSLANTCLPGTGPNDPAVSDNGLALSESKHKINFPLDQCSGAFGCISNNSGGWLTTSDPITQQPVPIDKNNQPLYLQSSLCYNSHFKSLCYFPYNATTCPNYADTWFNGGEVYLSLHQQFSDNIDNMIKKINAMVFSPAPGEQMLADYNTADTFNFALLFNSTPFDDGNTWVTWGKKTVSDTSNGKQPLALMSLAVAAAYINPSNDEVYTDTYSGKPDKNGNITETYKPSRGAHFDADGKWHAKPLSTPGLSNGMSEAQSSALTTLSTELTTLGDDTSVPAAIKLPLRFLVTMQSKFYGPGPNAAFSKLDMEKALINMLHVLALNGLIPGSSGNSNGPSDKAVESEMINPAKNVIDLVLARLLGCNVSINWLGQVSYPSTGCQTSDSIAVSHNVENLMQELYSIGDVDTSKGFVSGQFDMITKAEQVGEDVIGTVTDSVAAIMSHISGVMEANIQQNEAWALGGIGAAIASAANPLGSVGPVLMGATQLRLQLLGIQQMFSFSQSLMWLPLVIFLFSSLFVVGVSFAIIMPLTPFLFFWSGQVAWILGCVEAMVAAPLLLLAFVLPGGHGKFGHTVPGIKMLLNVIFRPVLMVIGLFVSITLTYILIHYSAHVFHFSYTTLMRNPIANIYTSGILAIMLVLAYTTFMMLVYTKCFSAIYVVPEKVMMWLGGQGDKAGAEELQQFTQGVTSTAKEAAQSGGQSAQAGSQSYQSASQQSSQAASQGITSTDQAIKATKAAKDQDKSSTSKGAF